MRRPPHVLHLLLFFLGTALLAPVTDAQTYPSKPVRIIVSLAPGGMADIFARTASPRLAEAGKQPFIVENRTGAGGNIGAELAAKSPPDGYTLYMGFHGTNAINPVLYGPKLPFDPFKDFTPVILVARVPNVLVVHPSVPVNSVQELVALARAKPNALSYASQGTGSSGHMAGELFKITAGLDIVHIPYKGAAPAIQALLAGETQMMFDIVSLALPQIRSGKMKALAVVGPQRVAVLPELPTMAEAGLPQVEGGPWFGLFAPTGTPRPVIEWVNREVASTFTVTEVRERFTSQGVVFDLGPPESFAAHVTAERERWRSVIERAGIKLE